MNLSGIENTKRTKHEYSIHCLVGSARDGFGRFQSHSRPIRDQIGTRILRAQIELATRNRRLGRPDLILNKRSQYQGMFSLPPYRSSLVLEFHSQAPENPDREGEFDVESRLYFDCKMEISCDGMPKSAHAASLVSLFPAGLDLLSPFFAFNEVRTKLIYRPLKLCFCFLSPRMSPASRHASSNARSRPGTSHRPRPGRQNSLR